VRPNLIIVRAGDESRHAAWLDVGSARSWDMIVSYYGDDKGRYRQADIPRFDAKGAKYPALTRLLSEQASIIARYDYIWLPDDDLECTGAGIDRLFQICRDRSLWLAQPALSADSQFSWAVTLRNPLCRLRFTNFVEIMMPCFERTFLERCRPSFARSESGWGLDHLWARLAADEQMRIAIVDEVVVAHRRPLSGPWYPFLKGRSALEERRELLRVEKIADRRVRTRALVDRGGRFLSRRSAAAKVLLAAGLVIALTRSFGLGYANRRCFRTVFRHAFWSSPHVQYLLRMRRRILNRIRGAGTEA
jgi:hypothetical protein